MFDIRRRLTDGGPSVVEDALGALLAGPAGKVVSRPAPGVAIEADLAGWPGPRPSAQERLLAAGAASLDRAAAVDRDAARLAAAEVRALAEFARRRPHAVFDRQPGEAGAMSAATREARPEALTAVSEWAVDEVALALRISATAAAGRLTDALVLVERLPATLARLESGEISWAHARQMIAVVGPVADGEVRARVETRVLGLLKHKTPPQLGDCARRIVLREDADAAARKLVAAVRERGVRFHDRRDGTATVALDLPLPVAAAVYRALEAQAEQSRVDGDERTKQQRMADVVADLVLRPGESGMPPVTIALTLVATLETMLGGSEPGQVEGHLVPAEAVRELGYTFGLMPRPAAELDDLPESPAPPPDEAEAEPSAPPPDEAEAEPSAPPPDEAPAELPAPPPDEAPAGPSPQRVAARAFGPSGLEGPSQVPSPRPVTPVRDRPLAEWMALAAARNEAAVDAALGGARQALLDGAWTDGDDRALLDLGALLAVRDVAGTGLAHRPHIAVVDMLRGSLVALTDAVGIRRGQALGPPGPTDRHDPTAELERFVRLRDRRCRFPGCRARARVCDLDHGDPWPAGRTEHRNLCCLCEHHHRLKHQAPGWRFEQDARADADPGDLAVTTPSGETHSSHPPRFGSDLDVPPY